MKGLRMGAQPPITIVPSAARTTAGSGAGAKVPAGTFDSANRNLAVCLDLTAISGSGASITLSVEWSMDGTAWAQADTADSFTALTAVGKKVKSFAIKGKYARAVWTVAGTTPSFTFSVSAYGV